MGAANVIPGVSGGTIALITEIFERLVNSIKSFNLAAIKLFFTGRFREFVKKTDFWFLFSVLLGIALAIVSLARILDYLFIEYPILVWAYFFGLILASVYFVGKRIRKWNVGVIVTFAIGAAIAVWISVMTPSRENDAAWYVALCGVVAACSMILPGLSGSFVLILMGNYKLVWIDAVNNIDFGILIPLIVGAGLGLLGFSYILSWVFKKFRDQTLSLLTGFILGSLNILWPWKKTISTFVDRHGEVQPLLQEKVSPFAYTEASGDSHFLFLAIVFTILGFLSIWIMEWGAARKTRE